jgi:hypothetical protein
MPGKLHVDTKPQAAFSAPSLRYNPRADVNVEVSRRGRSISIRLLGTACIVSYVPNRLAPESQTARGNLSYLPWDRSDQLYLLLGLPFNDPYPTCGETSRMKARKHKRIRQEAEGPGTTGIRSYRHGVGQWPTISSVNRASFLG